MVIKKRLSIEVARVKGKQGEKKELLGKWRPKRMVHSRVETYFRTEKTELPGDTGKGA